MAAKKPQRDLKALLGEVEAGACSGVRHRLPEEAQELLELARGRVAAGGKVIAAALARVIKREFGVSVSDDALRRHLNQGCGCDG